MPELYDNIGTDYSGVRCADPHIAKQLYSELRGASKIVNIGAGTGSYEPNHVDLVAVEPSSIMISQRKIGGHRVTKGCAENLPFEGNTFSHAMTVLSMHHWSNRKLAFKEINRVTTEKFVAISWDPTSDPFWLTRDYFPEIHELDKSIFPRLEELSEYFDEVKSTPLLIPEDCNDGFLAAYWKRPEAYLQSEVRQSISSFSKIANVPQSLGQLHTDLAEGIWKKNNNRILTSTFLDAGYKLITAKIRS